MRSKGIFVSVLCFVILFSSGCALFRYNIIPQETKGPHGGELVLIDARITEYIEFVVIPSDKVWTFQIYAYNKNLRPRSLACDGYLKLELPNGTTKGVKLWTTIPYFWSTGIGHLENKVELGDTKEFLAKVVIYKRRSNDRLQFKYPY